ncbi:polyhydroxyalkanoate depolymerase [Sphingopyxis granuli]|uniref:Polyhydroxyalkanoate depolymerase, intracellular n=1 Tax=Sphingopyxis granuli TaxID=267128 RepID=A0AA86GJB8_9SPHN|nr:polyhydroxyalkanoate depolymerase [Sphingopyxis granuli]AMG73279.1 Polyhydroxyalkanoate depolymerase, intracellular [Sphingopyxis granuli]UNK80431.1 polyhydroxyalkanoate depolymerase [Sphingopyxis granuli]
MLYQAFDLQKSWLAGASALATAGAQAIQHPANPLGYFGGSPMFASALEVFAHAAAPRGKPAFDLYETVVDGEAVRVSEAIEARKPFGQLKHFKHKGAKGAPKLLIVAPMSGHYATLLRGTVERMLPDHDVWITDWRDARNVPLTAGRFDLDDYVDYLIDWLGHIGPGAHMLAVCQPSVPCLAAAAVMAADGHKCRPKTLTMMGGPIDTRKAPTAVNQHATTRPHAWFQENVIATVPAYYPGAGRRVYPGFLQLAGFMSMNLGNHMMSHWEMFKHLVDGDGESADKTKEFYDEYRSVCDMTAEFYLQTVDAVFQRHLLPKGEMEHRGRKVDLTAIEDIAMLAIEGERDDISGIGQTKAALTLAKSLPAERKKYLMAKGVGHYGIFNGRKWREEIAPVVEQWIRANGG